MEQRYKEIGVTVLGWWIFFSSYLVLALVTITVVQKFKIGLDWRLAFPIFIKWEIILGVLALIIAVVMHIYKFYLKRFILLKGFIRTFLLYFISYLLTIVVVPYLLALLPLARVMVDEIESHLSFIMIILVIFRIFPQRNYNDPKGPKFKLPLTNIKKNDIKPFGIFHPGIDFVKEWGTPVYAAGNGKVVTAWPYKIYGNMVKIEHQNGFSTVYGHLNKICVQYGQIVKEGDLIGYVGNTGHSFEPHLHFEVRYKNRVVDPEKYLKGANWKKKN
ncbi:hypothetical protein BBF96_03170 [Anoxybacter fermentans]|uniref:M23ase beta-sheet core domain-containing protein n=1 Tax=Anoxybacter fermentans TaxID=1323375 RepID=A0A3S9SW21_9FIRM|nr:M23 family metallopeptidase [Anoxybacter fermentans]AZR72468.1 hypothetical protein BBF96_03170 [Anoxybacter fermentans]